MISGWDPSEENLQGPPRLAKQQTNQPQNPTSEPDSQPAPRNSRHLRILRCTIFLRKPPKPLSGRRVPRLEQYSNLLPRLILDPPHFASPRVRGPFLCQHPSPLRSSSFLLNSISNLYFLLCCFNSRFPSSLLPVSILGKFLYTPIKDVGQLSSLMKQQELVRQ